MRFDHLNSDGENMTQHPPAPSDPARAAAEAEQVVEGLRKEKERIAELERLNEDKFRHLEAYRKAADEDKARIASLTQRLAAKERKLGENFWKLKAADALADAVAALVTMDRLDSHSRAADALLDYRNPPRTERSDALAAAERRAAEAEKKYQWLLHNGGLLNEWAKEWNPDRDGTLILFLERRIAALSSAERKGEQESPVGGIVQNLVIKSDTDTIRSMQRVYDELTKTIPESARHAMTSAIQYANEARERARDDESPQAPGSAGPEFNEKHHSPPPGKTPGQAITVAWLHEIAPPQWRKGERGIEYVHRADKRSCILELSSIFVAAIPLESQSEVIALIEFVNREAAAQAVREGKCGACGTTCCQMLTEDYCAECRADSEERSALDLTRRLALAQQQVEAMRKVVRRFCDGWTKAYGTKLHELEAALTAAPAETVQQEKAMTGAELIAAERKRQIEVEGWTPEHDAGHVNGEMLRAAIAYAEAAYGRFFERRPSVHPPMGWPWDGKWWKPSNQIRELVKAGDLIAAEIDRLQRLDRAAVARYPVQGTPIYCNPRTAAPAEGGKDA